ncbi:MAG: hypothetical protein J2P23_09280 [Microlunatus sp.]|nr:hypothetical protein [Microlunatus sp.]
MTSIYPFLAVRDVDAAVDFSVRAFRATEERQRVRSPDGPQIADQPYGMRQGRIVDPFGHHWVVGGPLRPG